MQYYSFLQHISDHCSFGRAINIIEHPAFHSLLLILHRDIHDMDIPHHTKMHELILASWRRSFETLKAELKVSSWLVSSNLISWHEICRQNLIYHRHVVFGQSQLLSCCDHALDCTRWEDRCTLLEDGANCFSLCFLQAHRRGAWQASPQYPWRCKNSYQEGELNSA